MNLEHDERDSLELFVRAHRDRRVRVFAINGLARFPIIAPSGGIRAATMIYFYAGQLAGYDLGRGGPVKHPYGHSWGVELLHEGPIEMIARIKDELTRFSQYLDEQSFV